MTSMANHAAAVVVCLTLVIGAQAQNQTSAPAANQPSTLPPAAASAANATPESSPSMTGPLVLPAPITFDGGPFGQLDLDGVLSGFGVFQSNHFSSDDTVNGNLSNGQIFLQKTTSWWQFYVQAGAYNIVSLGTPYLSTEKNLTDLWGPVPVVYAKFVPAKNTSILIGQLPALMGTEPTFDFENMNIERGLLWNQENSVNRGVQVNQTVGKFTASFSWNDGFYSNRYSWLSGALTYTNGPHSIEFMGMGNLSQTAFRTPATPVQNNSTEYALIYTYNKGGWIVQPYMQYSDVPRNLKAAIPAGASTWGGALLLTKTFKHGVSISGRGEYITSSGNLASDSVNLLYGPGSAAWSITVTPTYQYRRFFARGDLSFVGADNYTAGDAFGPAGLNQNQTRGVIEAGFIF